MVSICRKHPTSPIRFCFQSTKFIFLYLIPIISAGLFVHSLLQRRSPPVKAHSDVHVFVSGKRQLCSLLYPVRQLHHVCRVDAEEDVQDFRQLRPSLDPPQFVVLFLCAERALHRGRPHPSKFLSDKVFLILLLAERPSSLHERCLYPILLAPHYRSYV